MTYTEDSVRAAVAVDEERLFAPWCVGRPAGWTPGPSTKNTIVVGLWLREELTRLGLNDDDRKTQEWFFNRWSRSREDVFTLAAEVLNDTLAGKIERDRKPHRRWG